MSPTLGGLVEKARRKVRKERNIEMLRKYLAGASYREIGVEYGLSRNYAYRVISELVRLHYSMGPKFERHRLPPDIDAKLKEIGGDDAA